MSVKNLLFLLCIFALTGCGSEKMGTVYDTLGNPVPQIVVRLTEIDDEGATSNTLEIATTDAMGRFRIQWDEKSDAGYILSASLPDGSLRGFLAGTDQGLVVHPISEALVSLIIDITSTPDGRTLSDFDGTELRDIGNEVWTSNFTELNLSDQAALKDFLRTSLGRMIALAAGGMINATSASDFASAGFAVSTATFNQDLSVCAIGYPVYPFSGEVFQFGLRPDGTLCGNNSDDLRSILAPGSMALQLPSETFYLHGGNSFPVAASEADLRDERTALLGPYPLQKPQASELVPIEEDSLRVSRKIYVPEGRDLVRYLESFENSGTQERTLSFRIRSSLLSENNTRLLINDLSPNPVSLSDRYFAAYDLEEERPSVGFIFQDGLGQISPSIVQSPGVAGGNISDVTYGWQITVPPGHVFSFLHYMVLNESRDPADYRTILQNEVGNPDMTGLTLSELSSLINFTPRRGTVVGEAGSVIGSAAVTAVNQSTALELTVRAATDGSFAIPLETARGELIRVTASDGLVLEILVP